MIQKTFGKNVMTNKNKTTPQLILSNDIYNVQVEWYRSPPPYLHLQVELRVVVLGVVPNM